MQLLVRGGLQFLASEVRPKFIEALRRELSLPNPEYISARRFGASQRDLAPQICAMEERDGWVRIPRGAIDELRALANRQEVNVVVVDERQLRSETNWSFDLSLRHYQQQAVQAFVAATQGVVCLPCGAGKTVVALVAMARLRQPTLVLVHTQELLRQWMRAIREILGVQAGVISGRRMELGAVTVAMVQSLVPRDPAQLEILGRRFGMVVMDEAHRIPARTFRSLLLHFPAKYRLGLTATPKRSDGLTSMMNWCLGQTVYTVSAPSLIQKGHLQSFDVREIATSFSYPEPEWKELNSRQKMRFRQQRLSSLIRDEARNELIVERVIADAKDHTCLVLTGQKLHCGRLHTLLQQSGVEAQVLTSRTLPRIRADVLERFRSGQLKVVIATSLADEGLDVPRLDRLFLVYPTVSERSLIQRAGRLMRTSGNKQAVLYDVVDPMVVGFARQAAKRRALYRKIQRAT